MVVAKSDNKNMFNCRISPVGQDLAAALRITAAPG
jgi:hypothetical protein